MSLSRTNRILSQLTNSLCLLPIKKFYHVTNKESFNNIRRHGIDLKVNVGTSRDLGWGLYLSPDTDFVLKYAEKMNFDVIIEYTLDYAELLKSGQFKVFDSFNEQFWKFAAECRICYNQIERMRQLQSYSIVAGPTLNLAHIQLLELEPVRDSINNNGVIPPEVSKMLKSSIIDKEVFTQVLIHDEYALEVLKETAVFTIDEFREHLAVEDKNTVFIPDRMIKIPKEKTKIQLL